MQRQRRANERVCCEIFTSSSSCETNDRYWYLFKDKALARTMKIKRNNKNRELIAFWLLSPRVAENFPFDLTSPNNSCTRHLRDFLSPMCSNQAGHNFNSIIKWLLGKAMLFLLIELSLRLKDRVSVKWRVIQLVTQSLLLLLTVPPFPSI